MSLIELMIAMTLGLILLAGLVTVFATSSRSQLELQRSAQQIENGRYAMDLITQDLHHAGYYGQFFAYPAGAAVPDPCATGDAAALQTAMSVPVQLYPAPDLTSIPALGATSCSVWINTANVQPGSDILVVRRAETSPLAVGSTATSNEVYLQANITTAEIQFGTGAAITSTSNASGAVATVKKKDGATAADIYKYRVHVYFVSTCSLPSGGGTICTGASDDAGLPIPTLKRLELGVVGGTRTYSVVPIAEGIDLLKVQLGIDEVPAAANGDTGLIGDGAADRYITAPTVPSVAELRNVVSAQVGVLSRNTEASAGHTDDKTYTLAGTSVPAYNDPYKRHAYQSEIRLVNLSSRRENP
ncbi:MAG: PilW family protein [Betaproteobacteria bacterium]|nr:PilW family protein [Betaproteobacteria bacterium]